MDAKASKASVTPRGQEAGDRIRWLFLLQGVVAVIVGLGLLFVPGRSLFVIVLLLGAYWFVRGIATLVYSAVEDTQRGWKIFAGAFGIIAGLMAMTAPLYVATVFFLFAVYFIAIQALLSGAAEFYHGIRDRSLALILFGALSILLGAILLSHPLLSSVLLAIWLGAIALIGGIVTIVTVLRWSPANRETAPA
jgi:uncharacterized membrane protein HdeD (DUF308 family)